MIAARLATVFTALMATVLLSCSDGGSNGNGVLSEQESQELEAGLQGIQEEADFNLVLPTYIPDGVARLPETDYLADGPTHWAYMLFWAPDRNKEAEESPFLKGVIVSERYPSNLLLCADSNVGNPEWVCENLRVGAHDVVAQTTLVSDTEISYFLQVQAGEVVVGLDFTWVFPASAPKELTDSMKEEALRMTESMLSPS